MAVFHHTDISHLTSFISPLSSLDSRLSNFCSTGEIYVCSSILPARTKFVYKREYYESCE